MVSVNACTRFRKSQFGDNWHTPKINPRITAPTAATTPTRMLFTIPVMRIT